MLHKALSRLAVFLSVLPMFAVGQTTTPILTAAPNDPNWDYSLYVWANNTNTNGVPSSGTNPNGAYLDNFIGTNQTNPWSNFVGGATNIDNQGDAQNTADFWTALAGPINSVFCWQASQVQYTSIASGETSSTNMVGSTAVEFLTQQSNVCNTNGLVGGGIRSTNTFGPYGFYSATMQLNNGQQLDQGLWMQSLTDIYQSINMEIVSTYEYASADPQWATLYNDPSPYSPNIIFNECENAPSTCTNCPYLKTPFFSAPQLGYPNLGNTFNINAIDWEPNYITYYLNGTAVASIANDARIPTVPMNIYLNSGWNTPNITSNNEVPGAMYVTNFSMYHLKATQCSQAITFSNNQAISNYGNPNQYAVQSSITFNGNIDFDYCALPQGAPTPAGFNFVFRAVNGITISNAGGVSFIAGANGSPGSKTPLVLMPTGCPN
jgi:beta-glucanase (GH16 family)